MSWFKTEIDVLWNWLTLEKAKVAFALQPVIDALEDAAAKDLKLDLGTLVGIIVSTVASGAPLAGVVSIAESAMEGALAGQGVALAHIAEAGVAAIVAPPVEAAVGNAAAHSVADYSTLNK